MRRSPLVLVSCLLAGCAWTARENRPVWNAFEATCVPESDGAFYAALPLTVPVGLCAIVVDTLVAHPIQVADDAFDDAADLWRDIDYEHAYYTQSGLLPVRAVATPLWFTLSFLGRSCFDVPSDAAVEVRAEQRQAVERQRLLDALRRVAGGDDAVVPVLPRDIDPELAAAIRGALSTATALGRLRIYTALWRGTTDAIDWDAAFTDPSAAVRYVLLRDVSPAVQLSEATRRQLCADPDEAVRLLARKRFAQ